PPPPAYGGGGGGKQAHHKQPVRAGAAEPRGRAVPLSKLFAPFGALEGVKAVVQEHHGHEDAIAYVKFAVASDAAAAIEALNETTLPDGCLINVHVKRPSAKGKGKG
ncbi:unnamed protein product, partial [Prorocentrum cordatum]